MNALHEMEIVGKKDAKASFFVQPLKLHINNSNRSVWENWNTEKKEEQHILWRIVGRKNRITQNDFKEYPKYWEKLLKYIL